MQLVFDWEILPAQKQQPNKFHFKSKIFSANYSLLWTAAGQNKIAYLVNWVMRKAKNIKIKIKRKIEAK